MKAIPKIEDFLSLYNGDIQLAQAHLLMELEKWAEEAQVLLNAGDYLIAKQKGEIKELKSLLNEATSNDGESTTFDKRVKQALK